MVRPKQGGPREGASGTAYPNRTDLNGSKPVPVQTVPGQTYGKAAEQQAAQRSLPMAGTPQPSTPTAPNAAPQQTQPQGPLPGELPWLHPTQRPNEPITAGLPTGPGPGPEALPIQLRSPEGSVKALLGSLASQQGAPSVVKDLAAAAGAGG